ncbi:MAG: hypothetical protein IKD79_03225 [Oscillospiraceae bacterium]|nr:hypothetical protein [Oscillospiraceae bacterium]
MTNQDPLRSPEAEALLKDRAALRQVMESPEGRRFIQLMSRGIDLRQAAQQARQGDASQLTKQLTALLRTPEGAQLADTLQRKAKK